MKNSQQQMTTGIAVTVLLAAAIAGCSGGEENTSPTSSSAQSPATSSSFATPTATTSRVPATPPRTPAAAPSTLPADIRVDLSDPDSVAAAAARIWYSWDTTRDTSPHDAKLRAVPLLDQGVAASIRNFPPVAGPGADWLDLTAKSAVLTVGADNVRSGAESGGPPDTPTSAHRLLEVTQTITTPTGPLPDRLLIVAISLTKAGNQWRVSQVAQR